ncbi:hypothetical protein MSAN_02091400 [Mycena sanguinolenta]|uniref:DUF6532 domain-containing protein n=1 Tax=Mycena sanguinolenta TaxID=230812 RepID=A0A8H6XI29_9AGAR|nr:hypothetical protein MSAN_02091400 [Mycena sanguinolenta]
MPAQTTQSQGRSSTRQHATRHDAAANAANKENDPASISHDDAHGQAATKKSRASTLIESDIDDEDDDHEGSGDQNSDNDEDDDDDDGSPVRGRARRVSEKQAQLDEERAQAAARKQEKAVKAAKAAKRKAGEIEPDTREPINDDFFTDRTITSTRPTATKTLAQHNAKVPPPPKFPSSDWRATGDHRDSQCHSNSATSHPLRHPSRSASPVRFHGRSPVPPQRTPPREPIRNINGGIVPDSVTLHLLHRNDPHTRHRTVNRSHSRSPRRVAPRQRSLSPRQPAHRSRSRSPVRTRRHSTARSPIRTANHPRSSSPRLPPRLRSPSPDAGDKRRRSSSSDSDDLRVAQSQRTTSSGGRTRAKDLDDVTKEYAVLAIDNYRCDISTMQGFPDSAIENAIVRKAWKAACEEMGEGMILTPMVARLIASRGSQLRGELKTKIRPLIDNMYGFKTGQNKKTIAFNRKLAEDLKEGSAFAFKDMENKSGLYKHPIFQCAVNAMWFMNQKDEGPRHPELFSPLPIRALALVLTAVENNIDERLTGIRTDVTFTTNDYHAVYEGHVKSLEQFEAHTMKYKLMEKILKRLHSVGRFHSGAKALNAPSTSNFSKSVLDAAIKEYQEGETTDDSSDAEE